MDIQNFIAEFKKTFVYDMLKDYVTDEKLFDHFVTENGDIVFLKEQTRQMWSMWQAAKAQSDKKIKLLLCDEHLQKCESPTGVFNSQYPDEEPCLICLAKEVKAQAVPDRLLVKSIREHVESHISEISVNDLFDKGWLAAMKCIQNNIDMLEAQEPAND